MWCHGNFIYKEINTRNNKILIDLVPIGKDLLKISVKESKVVNIEDTLVCLAPTLSK